MESDSPVVIYHEFCADGTAAAWIVKQKYPKCTLIPCKAGVDVTVDLKGKEVIYVDICPSRQFLEDNVAVTKSITILDHHISNYKGLQDCIFDNLNFVFDNNRSGCMIAWDYYNDSSPRPWFIDYIGDRDLWTWSLENSKEISQGLYVMKLLNFRGFDELFASDESEKKAVVLAAGKSALEEKNKIVNAEVSRAIERKFITPSGKEYRIFAFKGPDEYRSDIGNAVLQRKFADNTRPDFFDRKNLL